MITLIANQIRGAVNQNPIGEDLPNAVYNAAKIHFSQNFNDVKTGGVREVAHTGFDLATGWGTPKADQVAFSIAGIINGNTAVASRYTRQLAGPVGNTSGVPSIKSLAVLQFDGIGNMSTDGKTVNLVLVLTNLTPSSQSSGVGSIQIINPLRRVGKFGFKGLGTANILLTDGNGAQFNVRINGVFFKKKGRLYARGQFAAVDLKGNILKNAFVPTFVGSFNAGNVPTSATGLS